MNRAITIMLAVLMVVGALSCGGVQVAEAKTALRITTNQLPTPVLGQPYATQLQATGGSGSYIWSISSGTLPPGLTLSSSGLLSGTPIQYGKWTFTIQVTNGTQVAYLHFGGGDETLIFNR